MSLIKYNGVDIGHCIDALSVFSQPPREYSILFNRSPRELANLIFIEQNLVALEAAQEGRWTTSPAVHCHINRSQGLHASYYLYTCNSCMRAIRYMLQCLIPGKGINRTLKKKFGRTMSALKGIAKCRFLTFKVNFLCQKLSESF